MQAVRVRLGLAATLMNEQKGNQMWDAISGMQANAVLAAVAVAELNAAEIADLAVMSAGVPWAQAGHLQAILAALQAKANGSKKPRRSCHDFCALAAYGTPAWWDILLDPAVSTDAKLGQILQKALDLGCSNPSEHTSKLWASLLTLVTTSADARNRMSTFEKLATIRAVKKWFDARRRVGLHEPAEWIQVLPPTPGELAVKHPQLFKACFSSEQPNLIRRPQHL
jgi:hypothetical protein